MEAKKIHIGQLIKKTVRERGIKPDPDAFVFYSRNKGLSEKISSEGVNKAHLTLLENFRKFPLKLS
jgi:hypothetical protein